MFLSFLGNFKKKKHLAREMEAEVAEGLGGKKGKTDPESSRINETKLSKTWFLNCCWVVELCLNPCGSEK